MTNAIVLAAGKGTRMKTDHAKTMHTLLGKPMVGHIYDTLKKTGVDDIVFVVGHGAEEIKEYLKDKVQYAIQSPQLGSGHAVMQASSLKGKSGRTLIVNGDCPLIQEETYRKMLAMGDEYPLVVLTTRLENPGSYGRIIRDYSGEVEKIVERKDCTELEAQVNEVNAGIYCVDNELLWKYLPEIRDNNAQHEYYVTDLVAIFKSHGHKVGALTAEDSDELSGINNRHELVKTTAWLQNRINNHWLDNGVTLVSPENIWISPDTEIEPDTVIYGNVRIEGHSHIGRNCVITEGSYILDSDIGDDSCIISSRIICSSVEPGSKAGPWQEIRKA